jgi:uncharacterized protein (DUF302 family)
MSYYIGKTITASFEDAVERVTEELKKEGFGIITEINVQETLKKKLDVDFKKYRILGACNPGYAYKGLQIEEKLGAMLPCNVIVIEKDETHTEVAAINPLVSMKSVNNPDLSDVADAIAQKLKNVIDQM